MAYTSLQLKNFKLIANIWDLLVILIAFGFLSYIAWVVSDNELAFSLKKTVHIDLNPSSLPKYSVLTFLRMLTALFCSLIFTFLVAPLAAKNRHFEKIIIPLIDILESIPVLGFLSIALMGLVYLFPNSSFAPECAAIFAIFTSQVWNITLSLYQSIRTIPKDLSDAADAFRLTPWQKFWKVELPYATPGLLWNIVISMSGAWFFLVASEAITVNNQEIFLPGIGSYIGTAVIEGNISAIGYAILTMLIVILVYDQLIFRPILSWASKFKSTQVEEDYSWFYILLTKTKMLKILSSFFDTLGDKFVNGQWINKKKLNQSEKVTNFLKKFTLYAWNLSLVFIITVSGYFVVSLLLNKIAISEILHVFYLGAITGFKVFVLISITTALWVPVGVWIGLRPKLTNLIQPMIQFLAAFPANLFFPLVVILITKYDLNPEIWTSPLMILGTQWYILFNVIAGVVAIPKSTHMVSQNLNIKGITWWKRIILPSIFPYYITGAMAAAGGCWNACILADIVHWGDVTIVATGLGAYITEFTNKGDVTRIVFGISVMSIYVIAINRLLWHKLYDLAVSKYSA